MTGDTLITLVIFGSLCALALAIVLRIHGDFTAARAEDEPTSEIIEDEDEADPVYPFRRIGPVAADVVEDLGGRRS
ncbi:hypothetical protein OSH11_11905 [Kaistia dalseonensis]|uniref:Uncharacterized protein n=1 Tax=Kaistia dalseonensis TaxID=410840 RepID=A0ABU0H6R5_9HYPH|nr:hypothetical protein [Kaistia dalseonensis]MCX5495413.1 hypothetical protein [Kaistia dalseonensis]MDQ0438003.1 hypothetical protein [Kaistia dalseonensis]